MSATSPLLAAARLLPWLIPVTAATAIAGISGWIDMRLVGVISKPLTTLLIALYATTRKSSDDRDRRFVLAGLFLSVLGECAMTNPRTFVAGPAVFALAQCCYLGVSVRAIGLVRPGIVHAIHALAVGWAMLMWSARPLPLFLAVAAFLVAVGLMSSQAETWWWRSRGTPESAVPRAAAIGALWWLSADLTWTFSQFVHWVPGTFALVLPCYFLAQWNLSSMIDAKHRYALTVRTPQPSPLTQPSQL